MAVTLFRVSVVYFALYAVVTQILGGLLVFPGFSWPALGTAWPLRDLTLWLAEHVFGVRTPLVFAGNSGDTAFHWIQLAWMLLLAAVVTAAWCAHAGRRDHPELRKWFRLFLRFAVAAQMFYYGMAKVIPSQFPPPSLVTLVEPVGHLSLSDLLWTFIGASTAYQVFTGCAEVAAGLLLLTPQTTPAGALLALVDMTQVFVLNMTYDFGLKQISFHLMLMSLFLLAPDLRRLGNVLLFNRPAPASPEPELFRSAAANRRALVAQLAFGLYLVAVFGSLSWRYWHGDGGGREPKSVLYGIWDIEQMAVDGEVRPTVLNDYDRRWRRVIFDRPDVVVFQRTDDSLAHYGARVDASARTVALTKGTSRLWRTTFAFERPSENHLVLRGVMDEKQIEMRLQRVGLDTFRLLNSRFRWARPPDPYAG